MNWRLLGDAVLFCLLCLIMLLCLAMSFMIGVLIYYVTWQT